MSDQQAVQNRTLTMHEHLLFDVITRQAGTPPKAILEAVMNSIEAGATQINIKAEIIDDKFVVNIKDDGKGICSEQELIQCFETFGTPHQENENKIWAEFRMGRGQMFAFGENYWRTGPFSMSVDIKNKGLSYCLVNNLPMYNGCEINIVFYKNPIRAYDYPSINSFKDAIKKLVEFVEIPVYFNDEKISFSPASLKWTYEDEYAYYSFLKDGDGIKIYNMGTYVCNIGAYRYGTSGTIVSKNKLKMNFARNDIISDCPEYEAICKVIEKQKKDMLSESKKKNLSADERKSLLLNLRNGQIPLQEIFSTKIFLTAQKKYVSLKNICENKGYWTFAPENDIIADKIIEQGIALCLADSILDFLNYGENDKKNFIEWLLEETFAQKSFSYFQGYNNFKKYIFEKANSYFPFYKENGSNVCLSENYNQKTFIIPENKLTKVEKRVLQSLQGVFYNKREIYIGESDVADAWTDGDKYIAINKEYIKKCNFNSKTDCYSLLVLMAHEFTHDNNTENTHCHNIEFYQNFYSLIGDKYNSPLTSVDSFFNSMRRAKIEDIKLSIEKKKEEQELKRQKKLGII